MRAIAVLTIWCLLASPAIAAPQCAPSKMMLEMLAKRFKEVRTAGGAIDAQRFMTVTISEKGTWTVLVTNTAGLTCILAAGDDWEMQDPDYTKLLPKS